MSKNLYVGVNNVARKGSKVYVGVNGVARKVKKIYVGVNNVARECYSALQIVTWNSGTDAEIVAMVEASDNGLINLSDYWSIGNERTVSLSAMSATGVGESHVAQNVVFVLMDTNKYNLVTATSGGRTQSSFVVGMKDCLRETGYMNANSYNTKSWNGSRRRTWCNSVFYDAIPSTLRPIFKQFKTITASEYNDSRVTYSDDYFALFAEKEIYGTRSQSNYYEASYLSQISYYTTSSHRIKTTGYTAGSQATNWWERSPYYGNQSYFCGVNSNGAVTRFSPSGNLGISPFGCI